MTDHLKASPPERYEEISRHLLEQAQEELDKGDILQASDKVWGATAHAIKAVCQRMAWNHHAHNHLRAAANYLASQFGREDLRLVFGYYEHQWASDEVSAGISNARLLINDIAELPLNDLSFDYSHLPPLVREDQQRRLQMLTRKNRYSHGPQLDRDELDSLPPVKPPSRSAGDTDAG